MRSHQAGRTSDAAARYDEVLRDEPRNFAAWHLSGVLHAQLGNYDEAPRSFAVNAEENPAIY